MAPEDTYAYIFVFSLVGCAASICTTGSLIPTIGVCIGLVILAALVMKMSGYK